MALDLENSPYAMPLPRSSQQQEALGYNSRHYAQRIRDMGQSSKDSWIKRLWHHMFQGNNNKKDGGGGNENAKVQSITNHKEHSSKTSSRNNTNATKSSAQGPHLPPISANQKANSPQNTTTSKKEVHFAETSSSDNAKSSEQKAERGEGARSAPPRGREHRESKDGATSSSATPTPGKVIPAQLADSPYIPVRERTSYKVVSDKKSSSSSHGSSSRRSKENPFMKKPGSHPYLSQHKDDWKPRLTRGVSMISLEKRAKSTADKAMKEGKIFTCEGPYPLDTYVRLSLRRRGWVEKFGPKAIGSTKSTADKIECEDDEDFEAIMERYIPAPWEEDHGLYAIMSRIVRHYPAKFIWGGRNVNSMVLRQDVIVNHFPKARYFSSKVGLSNSLKELPWLCSQDAHDFFPRCYTICDDEKDDIIEDFRLTTCMCLLKWVVKMYTDKKTAEEEEKEKLQRENTKYEEVTFQEGNNEENEETEKDTEDTKEEENEDAEEKNEEEEEESSRPEIEEDTELESVKTSEENTEEVEEKEEKKETEETTEQEKADEDGKENDKEEKEEEKEKEDEDGDTEKTEKEEQKEEPKEKKKEKELQKGASSKQQKPKPVRVAPDLRRGKKKQLEIPVKAVDWSLSQLNKYLQSKNHDDLDTKSPRGITSAQWDQLITWFYQVANENASIPMTEGKLRECEEMLRRMKKIWPQYELDGDRNVWIVKPGDKSKGIGIEFVNKLDDIMKYIRDTTSGSYVLQKYVERPLLVCKCKFDIRQWFLVTDWNPLTVWFYKESYLRICSQEFSYDTMHEAVHLSNVAVQQNYLNDGTRNSRIPDDNFMPCSDFKQLLADFGEYCGWDDITYPGMKDAIVSVLLATQDVTENRKSAFELYGADFILTEDYQPWLLEINACPGMAPSSLQKAKLCAAVIDDTIKVVLDRRENKHCDTGNFELAFKDTPMPNTKCVETKFLLEGQRIRRGDLAKYNQIDQKMTRLEQQKEKKRQEKENGGGQSSPVKKHQEAKEEKDERKDYLSVDLYGGDKDKDKDEEDAAEDESEKDTDEKQSLEREGSEEKSERDTDRSQRSNKNRDKPPTAVKRSTTSAKLDKIEQILKQSPYNSPKPPSTEKQKKGK